MSRKWEGKGGIERYTTEIVGDKMQMLGSKGEKTVNVGTNTETINDIDFDDTDSYVILSF